MKPFTRLLIMAASPLLLAALWMDKQPAHRPYRAPVLAPPVGAVPVFGKETVTQGSEVKNPVTSTAGSLAQGGVLFSINCAMCHGITSVERGAVGKKLTPPPPGLDQGLLRGRSDAAIFKAVTFGFGRMPAFQDKLSPVERWDLVNFLRSRK